MNRRVPSFLSLRAPALVSMLLAAACGEAGLTSDASANGGEEGNDVRSVSGLTLQVVPTEVPVSADAVVLAQSVGVDATLQVGSGSRDLGTVRLVDPVSVSGQVVGLAAPLVAPIAALPGQEDAEPFPGEVRLLHDSSVQSYRTPLSADGSFQAQVVPDADYLLAVVPDDPSLPLGFYDLDLREDNEGLSIDVGAGVPIYGVVTEDGVPVAGAQVVAEQQGVETAVAVTNGAGFYELRVAEGEASVRCVGDDPTTDAVLEVASVPVGPEGLRRDFTYPAPSQSLVEARLEGEDGQPLDGSVEVRLTASSVDGLETQNASFVVSDVTDQIVLTRVPEGIYDVEVLPPTEGSGADYTPIRLTNVVVEGDTDLGTLVMPAMRRVEGSVADPQQQLIPRVAVSCREDGFGGRAWATVTSSEGSFTLDLPQVPVTCSFTPPVELTAVALTRRSFDAADSIAPSFTLAEGQTVTGRVTRDGEGEELVVVELHDREERLLGSALTDEEGNWTMQVDLSTVVPDELLDE